MKAKLFVIIVAVAAWATSLSAEIYSRVCGAESGAANIQWTLDTETGVLSLTGSGEMKNDFYETHAPWFGHNENVKSVVLSDGITSIGNYSFKGCYNLESVSIPSSVTVIGSEAFCDCYKLTSVTLPDALKEIGRYAFAYCQLTYIIRDNSIYTASGTEVE